MKLNKACTADEHYSYRIFLIRCCIACNVCVCVCVRTSRVLFCRRQGDLFKCLRNVITSFYVEWKISIHTKFSLFLCTSLCLPYAMRLECVCGRARMRSYSHETWIRRRIHAAIQYVALMCAELVENVKERKFTFLHRSVWLLLRSFLYVQYLHIISLCIFRFSPHMKWMHAFNTIYTQTHTCNTCIVASLPNRVQRTCAAIIIIV